MSLKVIILGCGNSAGTPAICNFWGNCDPSEPKNRRSRPSIAVQSVDTTLIIDTGPDIRDQINRENITQIDGILYTHAHGDHVCGIDDLRVVRLRSKKYVNVYGSREALADIERQFSYLFTEQVSIYPKVLEPHIIEPGQFGQSITVGDIEFTPFEQDHGTCKSLGYRFGDLAYSTDVVNFDQAALDALSGIKTWIIDGAGYKMEKNLVHLTLKQVFAFNEIIQAEKVYLTHLSPLMDYRTMCKELPDGYEPAYDGLVLEARI